MSESAECNHVEISRSFLPPCLWPQETIQIAKQGGRMRRLPEWEKKTLKDQGILGDLIIKLLKISAVQHILVSVEEKTVLARHTVLRIKQRMIGELQITATKRDRRIYELMDELEAIIRKQESKGKIFIEA